MTSKEKKSFKKYIVLNQADSRWGNNIYGKDSNGNPAKMKDAGCGPSTVANVMNDLMKFETMRTPWQYAKLSMQWGYRINGEGTAHGLFFKVVEYSNSKYPKKKLYIKQMSPSQGFDYVRKHPESRAICATNGGMNNRMFSTGGHVYELAYATPSWAVVVDSGWYANKYSATVSGVSERVNAYETNLVGKKYKSGKVRVRKSDFIRYTQFCYVVSRSKI